MANVCDVLVNLLSQAGVKQIFGVPGDAINALTEALRHQQAISFVHVNHEETGAFAACAQAKLTGTLGVCAGTSGPGAIHLLNGLYDAKCDHAPVLAITGHPETKRLGSDYQQEIDLHTLFADVSVYNQTVVNPEQFPYIAVQAIRAALEYRGVAHLNIPVDIAAMRVPYPQSWSASAPILGHPRPSDASLTQAARLLNSSEKIVILAGIGCQGAQDKVYAIAEKLGAPIVHALRGKELFPESHPYSIGGIGNLGVKPALEAMENCDLLFMIGSDFPYTDFLPKNAHAIQIDINPRQIGKRYPVDIGISGDTAAVIDALLPQIEPRKSRGFLAVSQQSMESWRKAMHRDVSDTSNPIKPQRLAYMIGEAAANDAIFVCDTGEVTAWTARYMQMRPGQRFTVSGLLASMAFGLPGAIGAKFAYPDRQVIGLCGDGGFSMLMTDFSTAVKYKLPLIIVVFNNNKLGMIQIEQESRGLPDYQTDNYNPDFAAFARLCGGDGISVVHSEDLAPAIEKAMQSTVPFVLNVRIDAKEIPMPPKITGVQALNYGISKIREMAS